MDRFEELAERTRLALEQVTALDKSQASYAQDVNNITDTVIEYGVANFQPAYTDEERTLVREAFNSPETMDVTSADWLRQQGELAPIMTVRAFLQGYALPINGMQSTQWPNFVKQFKDVLIDA